MNWVDNVNIGRRKEIRRCRCRAVVLSVSPSSERNEELWVVCDLFCIQKDRATLLVDVR